MSFIKSDVLSPLIGFAVLQSLAVLYIRFAHAVVPHPCVEYGWMQV